MTCEWHHGDVTDASRFRADILRAAHGLAGSVVQFLDAAGLDVRTRPLWALGFVVDPTAVTVTHDDPLAVDVTVPDATEPLAFTIEPDFTVTPTAPDP